MSGHYHQKYPEKHKEMVRKYKEKNFEKFKKWSSESYHRTKNKPENIIKFLLKSAKARAVKKNLLFTLIAEDITIPKYCPVMGVKFNRNTRRYGYSLDRKDPTKGYTPDNIWVISQIANAMKWDSTKEERIAFAKWVLEGEGGYMP